MVVVVHFGMDGPQSKRIVTRFPVQLAGEEDQPNINDTHRHMHQKKGLCYYYYYY